MDPVSDPSRPDPLAEPSPFAPLIQLLFRLIPLLAVLVLLPIFAFYFGVEDALMHPIALTFGRPAIAIISSKRVSTGRHTAGKYVDVNYQYSKDYAPRPGVKVNDAAYAAIALNSYVPMHYLPGCSSCVALDNDYGSARQQGLEALMILILIGVMTAVQWRYARIKKRP
jgi:hypothetical protein